MQPSPPGNEPRVLRCPHCGAPLDVAPHALVTRCGYCGHSIKLAEPSAAPRPYSPSPAPLPPAQAAAATPLFVVLIAVFGFVFVVSALGAYFWARPREAASAAPVAAAPAPLAEQVAPAPTEARAAPRAVPATPPTQAAASGVPLRALLGVSVAVDVDGSREHMRSLFPSVIPEPRADGLRYLVPVKHPWFSTVELKWKNERAGKLNTVGFHPPEGDSKLKNQKEIADCLSKGLGKPEIREIDHLAGDVSYFWGKGFPTAWANLYTTYLWLSFEKPQGVPPVTFPQVVRTLDSCALSTP